MDTGKELFSVCRWFYNQWSWGQGEHDGMVRQISIWASSLMDIHSIPQTLFETQKSNALVTTIDTLNEKFGDHTIRNGFLLYSDKLTTVPNGFLADKWDRMQLTKLY
jgi:hypothetical protein